MTIPLEGDRIQAVLGTSAGGWEGAWPRQSPGLWACPGHTCKRAWAPTSLEGGPPAHLLQVLACFQDGLTRTRERPGAPTRTAVVPLP